MERKVNNNVFFSPQFELQDIEYFQLPQEERKLLIDNLTNFILKNTKKEFLLPLTYVSMEKLLKEKEREEDYELCEIYKRIQEQLISYIDLWV